MSDLIRVEQHGDVTTVTMTKPERRNALSLAMIQTLTEALADAAATDAVGVILTGEGPIFSSGHDFGDMAGKSLLEMRHLLERCRDLMLSIRAMPQVVLARVQGPAAAAGFQLMASCDLAVATDEATFWAPGGKAGWFCHTPMVPIAHQVTPKRAMEIGLTGDPISARTALEWGLVNRVVPAVGLDAACADLLGRATRGSRSSKAIGKQTLYRQMDLPMIEAYDLATEVMAASSQTLDGQESLTSFVEKRPGSWQHR